MYVLGGSCGLGACPKCHLALIGSVEDISFDTGSCLIRLCNSVRRILHELRKSVHAGASYRKEQRPLFLLSLSDEEPILSLHWLNRSRTFLIVVRNVVDPRAHRIAPHQPGIARLAASSADSCLKSDRHW